MYIQNSIAVVTGGGSGLGEATAKHLASLGAKVAVLDINEDAAKSVAAKIDGIGISCDVTNEESVQNAIKQIQDKFGTPRICVNFAGILGGGKVVGRNGVMPLENFKKVIDVNLVGTFNVMRLIL